MDHCLENCPYTLNTTRVCGDNPIDISIEISRIGFANMKPNAVILINKNEVFDGIGAASLVHFPINAPILLTDGKSLNEETLNEIQRLSPKGYKGIHVILVGNISRKVSLKLKSYGFKIHHIAGRNHYETACIIPSVREDFKNILIISGEDYSEGIVSGYWSAHHGDPILFVQKNRIPCCTLEVIKRFNNINIYIIGSTKTISKDVERYLSKLDNVKRLERIEGADPYDTAVHFSKYKDSKTEFGWARNYRDGHAFTFGDLNHPMEIIAGVLFAHMGKHTPFLLTGEDTVPKVVEKYIKEVKPIIPKEMPKPPFMHGFILGDTKNISYDGQVQIENILSIDHEMMEHGKDIHEIMEMGNKMIEMDYEMMEMKHEMTHMGEDEVMDMKHEMMDKNHEHEMMVMEDLEYMHMVDHHMHHKDEENNEMSFKSNCEIKDECKCKNLKTNCLTVNIDEIIN